jgi:uncharacterized membrane protein
VQADDNFLQDFFLESLSIVSSSVSVSSFGLSFCVAIYWASNFGRNVAICLSCLFGCALAVTLALVIVAAFDIGSKCY